MKYYLYGVYPSTNYSDAHEKAVATFDKQKDANDYIVAARLVKLGMYYPGKYRVGSLLQECVDAYVQKKKEKKLPHNPKISWKKAKGKK